MTPRKTNILLYLCISVAISWSCSKQEEGTLRQLDLARISHKFYLYDMISD